MKSLIDVLEGLLTSKDTSLVYKSPIVILLIKMFMGEDDICNYRLISANILARLGSDKSKYSFRRYIRIPDNHKDPRPFIIVRSRYSSRYTSCEDIYYFIFGNMPGAGESVYLVKYNKWSSSDSLECIEYKDTEEFLKKVYDSYSKGVTFRSGGQESIYTFSDPEEINEIARWLKLNARKAS